MDDMYIGKFLDDRYEILEKIGTGGMAVVYKARCHRLNRFVAIKILKSDLAQNPELRRRFHAESQAVAMLSHPNIVSVYDVNHTNNVDYIVMELIEGITLKQYINRKGVLNWKEALHFTTQIVKALEHAHSRGIIHRDIKPHNIMILRDGNVKVADFGIARLLTTQNTLTQEALGSVHYISPEQAKGGRVDARSDIYSVGVVMYEMLTSRLPFEGDSPVSIAIQHISAVPLMPREINPEIPKGLEDITMHAMDPNLNTRYPSATALLADLEEFRQNPSVRFDYSAIPSLADSDQDDTRKIPSRAVAAASGKKHNGNAMSRNHVTAEEYRKNRKKASKTSMLIGVFCVLVFLAGLVWFMWTYVLKGIIAPDEEATVRIPQFVGQAYEDVLNNSDYTKYYTFEVKTQESDTEPEGNIIAQSPDAYDSMSISEGKISVTLTISSGTEPVYMLNVINMNFRDARVKLEQLDMGLIVDPVATPNAEYVEGCVFETYPAEGELLVSGMTITLMYSSGPESIPVEVPDLIGKTESEATRLLENAGLVPNPESRYDDDAEVGEVFYQSYDPGATVESKAEITFYVSLGPEVKTIPVPYLIGLTEDMALDRLKSYGLEGDCQKKYSDTVPVGQVYFQSIESDQSVLPQTVITFYVSLGPENTGENSENPENSGGSEDIPPDEPITGNEDNGEDNYEEPDTDEGDAVTPNG